MYYSWTKRTLLWTINIKWRFILCYPCWITLKCMEKCEQTVYGNTKYARQTRWTIILNMRIYSALCISTSYNGNFLMHLECDYLSLCRIRLFSVGCNNSDTVASTISWRIVCKAAQSLQNEKIMVKFWKSEKTKIQNHGTLTFPLD